MFPLHITLMIAIFHVFIETSFKYPSIFHPTVNPAHMFNKVSKTDGIMAHTGGKQEKNNRCSDLSLIYSNT